jgi:hypothetical protein
MVTILIMHKINKKLTIKNLDIRKNKILNAFLLKFN